MAVHDFRSQRLFVDEPLFGEAMLEASREQANYLLNVLRMGDGEQILLFNGADGEWRAEITAKGRKKCDLKIRGKTRDQPPAPSLTYCFAPLKQARLDYMVQKAVEMGCGRLQPVITQYTQVRQVNAKRLRANAIEAAEQCGILTIPEINAPVPLAELPSNLAENQAIIFCDEEAPGERGLEKLSVGDALGPALLIGPEGGFSNEEREWLNSLQQVRALGLGPRILRADTAAVAALAIIQARLGDWYTSEQA